jgi:hypothetical protein
MNKNKTCLVALYNSDWQWALILEYAMNARERQEEIEILDLTGVGCANLREIVRFYHARGKFFLKARRHLEYSGIRVTRPALSLIKLIFGLQYLIKGNMTNNVVAESIKSSVSDKISKQSPESKFEKQIQRNEYRAGIEFQNFINKYDFPQQSVYVMVNGRFSKSKLLLNLLQSKSSQSRVLEFGNSPSSLQIFTKSPHNLNEHENQMNKLWDASESIKRVEIADLYFRKMRFFDPVASVNWTKNMQLGSLPVGFDPSSFNVVFFTSNNLELLALEHDFKNDIFENQQQAIDALFQVFGALGWNLYLRLHPTRESHSSSNGHELSWVKICKKHNATLIGGSSSVDSFALAHGSKVAAHFNSSIGPQLIYENHPAVITLGPTFWKSLASRTHISNKDQLLSYAKDQTWATKMYSSSDVLPWAFYRATRGIDFRFVRYDQETARWDISE